MTAMGSQLDNPVDPVTARRSRLQFVLLVLLFLLPPVSAWIVWKFVDVSETVNAGILITPARPLDLGQLEGLGDAQSIDTLKGRWVYAVFANDGACNAECEQQLFITRQIRIGVNKDIPRVQRVLIVQHDLPSDTRARLQQAHQDLVIARVDEAAFLDAFAGEGFSDDGSRFFLIDPLANLMMYYDSTITPKKILRDLQKLLKVSQIG